MNDLIYQIIIPVVTALLGVWSGKYLTKREKKKSDLDTIAESTQALIESLSKANEKINDLTKRLIDETDEKLKYLSKVTDLEKDKIVLNTKIDNLTRKVEQMQQVINRLAKRT